MNTRDAALARLSGASEAHMNPTVVKLLEEILRSHPEDHQGVRHIMGSFECRVYLLTLEILGVTDTPKDAPATCVTGTEGGCFSYRCGSDCTNTFDRMHPCPACASEEWRNGRLLVPAMSETVCVHFVGLTPGLWCGACNTHPEHPDLAETRGAVQ